MSTLYIIRGLPGSGKSAYAKSLDIHYVEADMYFMKAGEYYFNTSKLHQAHQWCYNKVSELLATGVDVAVSNTFTTVKEMQNYFNVAAMYNADVVIVEMKSNYGSVHNVPEETIAKMKARWQDTPEGYEVRVVE